MPISHINLDPNLATDTLGHPASAPPLHPGYISLRNTHPTSVQSVPLRRSLESAQSLLALLDEQLVSAAQNVGTADQAFVAADQAGELSGSGLNLTDLTALGADLNLAGAGFDVSIVGLLAGLAGGLDPSSAADLAAGVDPVSALDPSIFADLLSSIGL